MRTFLMLLKYLLATLVVTTVGSVIGTTIGCAVARIANPRPNPHLCGMDYLTGGALIGALLGLVAVIALAVQENKRRRQRSIQSEQTS